MIGRGADVRIRWLLDVTDRGAGKKLLTQDRAIRRSMQANDAQHRRSASVATASDSRQVSSSRRVVGAQETQTRATRGLATAVQRLNATQSRALSTEGRVQASATRTAAAYDKEAAAARRAAAANRTAARTPRRTAVAPVRAATGTLAGGAAGGAIASGGARGGAVALAVGVGAALQQTIQFDKAMRNVNSIAQLGEKRFEALGAKVRELGGRTAQMPKTLAAGLYDLVSSGFNARQSMQILGKSARAATAGLTTTEVSTKAVAAVLNAYRMPASKAGEVSDQLFRTVDRGVISFEDLATTVGDVLPFASSLGVGLEEVGAATATMTKAGISAPETMTRIKNVMVSMIKPGEGLTDALGKLGVESGEALIKQKGFQGALDALIGSTDGSKAAVAKLFPNIRALGGAMALTGKNSRSANADLRGMEKSSGATARALSQQSKSVSFQWEKMKAQASDLAIEVGRRFVPAASGAVSAIGKLVAGAKAGTGAGGQLRSIFENIGTTVAGVARAVAPAAAAIGKVVLGFANFASTLLASRTGVTILTAALGALAGRFVGMAIVGVVAQFGKLITVVRGASVAIGLLGAAIRTNPIGAIATVVGLVAGAMFGLNNKQKETAQSARDLASANESLRNSLQEVRDLDLDAQGRRLAARRATLNVAAAEQNLANLRRSGTASSRELKEAELSVKEARLESKRANRELGRSEEDAREKRKGARLEGEETIKTTRKTVNTLTDERDKLKETTDTLRKIAPHSDEFRQAQEKLRAKNKELANAQRELNDAIRQFSGKHVNIDVEGIGPAKLALQSLQTVADTTAQAIRNVGQDVSGARNRGGRRGGRFAGGGVVGVSSGEAIRLPNGVWGEVPGARTAADNVTMWLPHRSEVYTDHGQMLLASGASRGAALSQQMPHFRKGGRQHTNYSAGRLTGLSRWAGFPPGPAVIAGATSRGESTGDTLAHATSGEDSRGLFQINVAPGANPKYRSRDLFDPEVNARTAREIWQAWGRKFNAWSVYTSGAYRANLAGARRVKKWEGGKGAFSGATEGGSRTVKLPWRPSVHGRSEERMDRFTRRQYLQGLDPSAFSTGFSAGQEGYRNVTRIPGFGALVGGVRIEGSRPTRTVKTKGGVGAPTGKAGDGSLAAVKLAADQIEAQRYAYQWGGGHGVSPIRPTMGVAGGPHRGPNPGYDCSGAIGKLLQQAGVRNAPSMALHSSGYAPHFQSGPGRNFTLHSTGSHTWATIGNRGWGTSSSNPAGGPGWHAKRAGGAQGHPRGMRAGGVVGKRYRRYSEIPALERNMPFRDRFMGLLPGLQGGGVVRAGTFGRQGGGGGGGRSTPVTQRGGYFGGRQPDFSKLDEMLAKLRQLGAKAGYDATLLLSQIGARLDNAHQITYRELVKTRRNLLNEIRQLMKHGTTTREEVEIKRLRAAIDVVNLEMGRRTGQLVRHQQHLAQLLDSRTARLDQQLRRQGVDAASLEGVNATLEFQGTVVRNLREQKSDLRKALAQAKKADDKAAVAELRAALRDVNSGIGEAVTRRIELVREAWRAWAQEKVSGAQFAVDFQAGTGAQLAANQRLARTENTPAGMLARAANIQAGVGGLTARRDALVNQAIVAARTGDTEGARSAWLAAQAATTDITNALADAADLIRDAAVQASQNLVDTAQFRVDKAMTALGSLDISQRGRGIGFAESPEGMRERAAAITSQLVPALGASRDALYAQARTMAQQFGADSPEARQALLAAEGAGNELASALLDASELLRDAGLKAAQNVVDTAAHGRTMADLAQQRLELEQRLGGTFEQGGVARADFIRQTVMPAIQAEIAALQAQQAEARAAGDADLARQIAEAIYGKENEMLQAQLDALEQTAENTDKLAARAGALGFEFGGQDQTDLLGSGVGV